MSFQIKPLPQAFLDRARNEGLDDQGQPVRRFTSEEGGEPWRDVLRRALPGEELILASHCPYEQTGPFREYGPAYILAHAARDYLEAHLDETVTLAELATRVGGSPSSWSTRGRSRAESVVPAWRLSGPGSLSDTMELVAPGREGRPPCASPVPPPLPREAVASRGLPRPSP